MRYFSLKDYDAILMNNLIIEADLTMTKPIYDQIYKTSSQLYKASSQFSKTSSQFYNFSSDLTH